MRRLTGALSSTLSGHFVHATGGMCPRPAREFPALSFGGASGLDRRASALRSTLAHGGEGASAKSIVGASRR